MPISFLRRLWYRHRSPYALADWHTLLQGLPAAAHLGSRERERLGRLAVDFLADKTITGADGLEVDDGDRLLVAANACVPVLELGLDWYDGWYEVVVYPDNFVASGEFTDPDGIVHNHRRVLAGEAWHRGPIILSRRDVLASLNWSTHNVVIHEFAHKLDMGNGIANGMPPLHRGMDRRAWTRAMSSAYDAHCQTGGPAGLAPPDPLPFDPYACESPGEFFAVMSEEFFVDPIHLRDHLPEVYRQLTLFYRQDPAT